MEIALALIVVVLSAMSIFRLNTIAAWISLRFSDNAYLDNHAKYQMTLLLLAVIVLFLVYLQDTHNFWLFFSYGNLSASAEPVFWFGIGPDRTWIFVGLYLCIIITLGTLSFVYFQFRRLKVKFSEILPYIGWVVLFSLTNSFSEEAIFRLGVISPLFGIIDPSSLILVSAIIFGLAHFGGMPHGLIGMLMAGFLGWFLAKSVIETEGIFWAWLIHFIQDVVIYIGFMLNNISVNQTNKRAINV